MNNSNKSQDQEGGHQYQELYIVLSKILSFQHKATRFAKKYSSNTCTPGKRQATPNVRLTRDQI